MRQRHIQSPFQRVVDRLDLNGALTMAAQRNDLLPPRPEDDVSGEVGKRFTETLRRDLERGRYDPARAYFVSVPKSLSSTRPAALLTLGDRVIYEALVATLRPRIDSFLLGSGIVFWPRGRRSSKQWQTFEHSPLAGKNPYIVVADISGFYESINHERLSAKLVSATGLRDEVEALHAFLARTMGAERGLPQGLEASDALATAYLAEVDFNMIRAGHQYARHGDDIRVGAGTFEEARAAIYSLELSVRSAGLILNSAKTKILRRRTYESELSSVETTIKDTRDRLLEARLRAIQNDPDKLAEAISLAEREELAWGFFYHGNVSLQQVIDELRPTLEPDDVQVAERIFKDTMTRRPGQAHALSSEEFHQRMIGSLVRLSAARSDAGLRNIGTLLISFPDKTEVLCHYLLSLAASRPSQVATQLTTMFVPGRFRTEWETAWGVRVFSKLPHQVPGSLITELAKSMRSPQQNWLVSVEVAKLLAMKDALSRTDLIALWNTSPVVFRADLLVAAGYLAEQHSWARAFLSASIEDPIHTVVRRHIVNE